VVTHVIHRVVHAARHVYHAAVSYVRTAYQEVKQVAKAGAAVVAADYGSGLCRAELCASPDLLLYARRSC
jgi:hypothetical protein